jgi:hypothetical protein
MCIICIQFLENICHFISYFRYVFHSQCGRICVNLQNDNCFDKRQFSINRNVFTPYSLHII